mgnify:CR=1 FL=1
MEKQLSEKLPRIEVVDALRGFAVMAILLVHNLEHFIFPVYPTGDPGWLNILNDGVFNITFSLFAGKAYAIFRSEERCSDLHSIFSRLISNGKGRILAIVFFGVLSY